MKLASDLHYIILMATVVQCNVCMIGLISLANLHSIISADYTSLKEQTQVARGIRIISITITMELIEITITSLLMIYLVNADPSRKNNIKTRTTQHHQQVKHRMIAPLRGAIRVLIQLQITTDQQHPNPLFLKGSHYFCLYCLI